MASPYRADHVGSLLRPPELIQARLDQAEGKITEAQLREIEDASILKALELERQSGIDIVTDGEYRRSGWSGAGAGAFAGLVPTTGSPIRRIFAEWEGPNAEEANTSATTARAMVAGSKISAKGRLVGYDASFLKQHAGMPWKITMPGSMSVTGGMFEPGITDKVYPTRFDLAADVAKILNDEVKALIADGISYIQLDSLHYVERITDERVRNRMVEAGEDPDEYLNKLIELDNAALAGARGTDGVTVGLHMCRGNNRSRWHAEGSYEAIAEKAFSQLNVDRFLLEYESERAGSFEPLRFVPRDKMVVLGIVSSKLAELESVDFLSRRIEEASKYISVDQLAISPQCGFASTMYGNLLTWDEQRKKLELVAEVGHKVLR